MYVSGEDLMTFKIFNIGDYAVCPGHGVGQISDLQERDLAGEKKKFFVVKILANGMTVMVPECSETGIRPLVGQGEIEDVYDLLNNHDVAVDNSTWNRRHRDYMAKIKTGSLLDIADVLRALFLLKHRKNLSFGEKKMLDQCRGLLAQEIAISNGGTIKDVEGKIDSYFS
jgi:CarD family transcriptional regulator